MVRGPSRAFNPLLTEQSVQQALKDDPEGARSGVGSGVQIGFGDIPRRTTDRKLPSTIVRPLELPPRSFKYYGFVDPSGGRHDAYTLCIGHKEGDGFVADVV